MRNRNDFLENGQQSAADGAQSLSIGAGERRRRFIKGGLAGGGVVLSVASRQVLAQTGLCRTASGFTSLAASGPRTSNYVCDGFTPLSWADPQRPWPGGYTKGTFDPLTNTWDSSGTKFNATFGGTKYNNGMSMMRVIKLASDPYQIGGHFVAALLNAQSGAVNVMTVAQIKTMWMSYVNNGSFTPIAGVVWNPAQIVDYLKSTMTH
jgi:hypothetical protein